MSATRVVALDTETTGLELRHSCRPFFISTWSNEAPPEPTRRYIYSKLDTDPLLTGWSFSPEKEMRAIIKPYENGVPVDYLEGFGANLLLDYDPKTRNTSCSYQDKVVLSKLLQGATVVFHNAFYDMMALAKEGIYLDFADHPSPFNTADIYYLADTKHFPDPADPDSIVIPCADFHDTMLACHAYDSKGPRGLKDAAFHYLLINDTDEETLLHTVKKCESFVKRKLKNDWALGADLKGKGHTKYEYALPVALYKNLTIADECPVSYHEALAPIVYGSIDAYRTLMLHYTLQHLLKDEGRLDHYDIHRAQLTPCFKMQCTGISLSAETRPLRTDLSKAVFLRKREVRKQAAKIAPKLFAPPNKPFNPNSPKQLGKLFFSREGFGCSPISYTETGEPSTSSATRKHLASSALENLSNPRNKERYEFLKLITSWDHDDPNYAFPETNTGYDAWNKSVGYLDSYLRYAIGDTVHPSFNPTGTDLTRFSSSNPNGQNIGTKDRVPLRRAFGPTPGWTWYALDYSQLELRLFAAACEDATLLSAFTSGRDFHELVACEIFNKLAHEVTKSQRTSAKYINFGLIYGAGQAKIDALAGFYGAYDRYCRNFPEAATYMKNVMHTAERQGYVETLYGYPLHLGNHPSYKGVNYIVQGTAGQIVKYAMMDLETLPESPIDWYNVKLILNVHDELLFAVRNVYKPHEQHEIVKAIAKIMADQGNRIGVHTPVECGIITTTWKEKQDYEL